MRVEGRVPGSELGTARFEDFLRRLFSVKGRVAPAVEPKLSAGIDLLRPPGELAESALLAGWRGFESFINASAVAGQYSWWELRPPAIGNGVIAVVEFVGWYAGVALTPTIGVRDTRTGGAAVTDIGTLDNRYGSIASLTANPAFKPFQGADVAAPGVLGHSPLVGAGTNTFLSPGPYILASGFTTRTFQVVNRIVNVQLNGFVRWWERPAEPSELAAR